MGAQELSEDTKQRGLAPDCFLSSFAMNRSSTWWEARQAKSATRSWQRIDYDAMGYAAAAEAMWPQVTNIRNTSSPHWPADCN